VKDAHTCKQSEIMTSPLPSPSVEILMFTPQIPAQLPHCILTLLINHYMGGGGQQLVTFQLQIPCSFEFATQKYGFLDC
jgi:hypothetical protein